MQKYIFENRNEILSYFYKNLTKPIFFSIDAEKVHTNMLEAGQWLGSNEITQNITDLLFGYTNSKLKQEILDIKFSNPVGLAAGFDYEANLPQILPHVGFGFGTIGTITNQAYEGNPRPMLGRLPKSKSLLVNKGFKNQGIKKIAKKLKNNNFDIPIGISIGRTNTLGLKTQKQSIADIARAFATAEQAKLANKYYELNISCPNLKGNITFYPPKNLADLLKEIDKLRLSKPLFIKMPIEKTDKETLAMLEVIVKHEVAGVIFGNLQKDRKDPALDPAEVSKWEKGNFSGKPTWKRSNQLVQLAYRHYNKKLLVIGCGGIFSAEDAYTKIRLGASLVQLITGMIYEGPSLISSINLGLVDLLEKDGFKSISEAIGVDNKKKLTY